MILEEPKLMEVGNIFSNEAADGRVYDPEGLSPSLRGFSYGWSKPKIIADRTRTLAGKGRNLESPKDIANTLSGVEKDNLVILAPINYEHKAGDGTKTRKRRLTDTVPALQADAGHTQGSYVLETTCAKPNTTEADDKDVAIYDIFNASWRSEKETVGTLRPNFTKGSRSGFALAARSINGMRIRRLTPIECERLQGFPDGWTEGLSDTGRYKVLGNAVSVPVIEFLGKRILERCFNDE